jgi:hypothetical protein
LQDYMMSQDTPVLQVRFKKNLADICCHQSSFSWCHSCLV